MEQWYMVFQVIAPGDLEAIRELFAEYASGVGEPYCFEGFERELAGLPGEYAPPSGRLFLAERGAGCVALRQLGARTAEIKRLYVRPAWRGRGLGRSLAQAAVAAARETGCERVVLDSLPKMEEAIKLYRSLGFGEIPPYLPQPTPGARCFELKL
ncbi:MAG: GNAT family N-acetyltransferase [Pseudomonadota bacterium]|nr:GNAT family N-acetyltransferase [Pseudomonadota bacterium]